MTIDDLFELEVGENVSVLNEPFHYVGHAEIELEGGQEMRWFYDSESKLLSVAPEDEEFLIFQPVDDVLEPENDMIFFQNKEYEFTYEDGGNANEVLGETDIEEEGSFMFSDYQAPGGSIIRLITSSNTGETNIYVGQPVSEDDILGM